MKRKLGIILLILIWGGLALRWAFPADLHGGYPFPIPLVNMLVDLVLVYPPASLFKTIAGGYPSESVFLFLTVSWGVLLSVGIYFLLVRSRKGRP